MQSKLFKISAVFLCFVIIFAFSSCGASDKDDNSEEFQAATLSVPKNAPVSESEIIDFYNNLVSDLQKNENLRTAALHIQPVRLSLAPSTQTL